MFESTDAVDEVAMLELPQHVKDAGYLPVITEGDGNCCARSVSKAVFGTESRHVDLHLRMVQQAVINRNRFLDPDYLEVGCRRTFRSVPLTVVFAQYSGGDQIWEPPWDADQETQIQKDLRRRKSAAVVYDSDVFHQRLIGSEMGIWQIFQLANVVKRPIELFYPLRKTTQYCSPDFNRIIYPLEQNQMFNEPIKMFWTSVIPGGRIEHYVPLLKKI